MTDGESAKARVGHCRQVARRVLKAHKVTEPGTPLEAIAAEAGYRVLERDWPPRTSGILLRSQKVIGLNANQPVVRRRFSLAHELGHHFLNHHLWFEENHDVTIDNPPREGCEGRDQVPEREANIFAAELVVPRAVLKRVAARGRTPQELARMFQVSEEAMFYSLQDHKLLGRL